MMYFIFIFTAVFFVYITFENLYKFRQATIIKVLLTSSLAVTMLILTVLDFSAYRLFFTLGMFFAIIGDFFLQYIQKNNRFFKLGITAFLATQICYLAGFHILVPFTFETLICAIPTLIAILCLKLGLKWDTSAEDPILTIYTVGIALTAAKGLSTATLADPSSSLILLSTGAVLFYASDAVLGIWNYTKTHILLADLNWILYFGGQLLIAMSFFV